MAAAGVGAIGFVGVARSQRAGTRHQSGPEFARELFLLCYFRFYFALFLAVECINGRSDPAKQQPKHGGNMNRYEASAYSNLHEIRWTELTENDFVYNQITMFATSRGLATYRADETETAHPTLMRLAEATKRRLGAQWELFANTASTRARFRKAYARFKAEKLARQ
ncbi:MAG: hypothetical protein ACREB3_01675 [Burkholderiales bacterium]